MSNPEHFEKGKGRPKKRLGFKGTLNSQMKDINSMQKESIHFQIEDNDFPPLILREVKDPSKPTGLQNEIHNKKCVNVCFFNAIIQILHSIPELCRIVKSSTVKNKFVTEIRTLFQKMEKNPSDTPVQSSVHVYNLKNYLPDYAFKDQYDAHECLTKIIENLFPNTENNNIFHFELNKITRCNGNGCKYAYNQY